jgi:hypothetical protein
MAKTQNHMNQLQLCQPFYVYKNSVVDKDREKLFFFFFQALNFL